MKRKQTAVTRLFACAAIVLTGGSLAQAFGGGEVIVSQQVISDVAVGESVGGEGVVGGAVGGGCANGDCGGGSGMGGSVMSGGMAGSAEGVASRTDYGQPDLFYNYYTRGQANAANAQMYLSPHPVPPNVGHTFYTYQPFYPHEMLYWHKDRYHNYYDNGRGLNRTRATYYSPPVKQAASNFYWNVLRIPR